MDRQQPQPTLLVRRIRPWAVAALIVSVPSVLVAQSAAQAVAEYEAERDARPFAALSNTALSMRDSIVVVARSQIGTRYRFGGTTPAGGFDCSGFVRFVLASLSL